MGYTHYWKRRSIIAEALFTRIVEDFSKILPELGNLGVELAGGLGEGAPEINDKEIFFNGVRGCGHEKRELGIAWPGESGGGVSQAYAKSASRDSDLGKMWFRGRELLARTCGGDCSHESFHFPRMTGEYPENQMFEDFCKTAFKPYDLAVQICLIIAQHYLGPDGIEVRSDGGNDKWQDAIGICQHLLGFGAEFSLATRA